MGTISPSSVATATQPPRTREIRGFCRHLRLEDAVEVKRTDGSGDDWLDNSSVGDTTSQNPRIFGVVSPPSVQQRRNEANGRNGTLIQWKWRRRHNLPKPGNKRVLSPPPIQLSRRTGANQKARAYEPVDSADADTTSQNPGNIGVVSPPPPQNPTQRTLPIIRDDLDPPDSSAPEPPIPFDDEAWGEL